MQKFEREFDVATKVHSVIKQDSGRFKKSSTKELNGTQNKLSVLRSETENLSSKDSASNREYLSFYENKTQLAIQQ